MPVRAVGIGAKMGSRVSLDTGDDRFSTEIGQSPKNSIKFEKKIQKFEEQKIRSTFVVERLRDSPMTVLYQDC